MVEDSAMVQIETQILVFGFNALNSHGVGCHSRIFCAQMQSVQSRVAVPRQGQTGRGPPEYFIKPLQFRGCPSSTGAPGGGQGSLLRGSKEEPGSSASMLSIVKKNLHHESEGS